MLAPQPADFCTQCQAPIYWMRGKYQFTCLCDLGVSADMIRQAVNTVINGHPPETPQFAPQALPVASDAPQEEITHSRAVRVYQELYKAIYHHQSECEACDRLAKADLMCVDCMSLWRSLRWWGRRMETEENLSA